MVDSAYFNSIFPELSTTSPAVVDAMDSIADLYVAPGVLPDKAQDYAKALVIAHFIVLGQQGGAGMVTSDRVGAIGTSYAALPTNKGQFNLTSYGQRFIDLVRTYRLPTMFVGGAGQLPPPFGGPQPTWDRRSNPRSW